MRTWRRRALVAVLVIGTGLLATDVFLSRSLLHDQHAPASPAMETLAATPQPLSLSRYENPDYPYTFNYPRGWSGSTSNPDDVSFRGTGGERVQISVKPVPETKPAMTLPIYADRAIEALRRQSAGVVELQRSRVSLANAQSGVEVDLSWTDAAGPQRSLILYVVDADLAFEVRADAPAGAFVGEHRLLEGSLRSFNLTPSD
jgi:hypothetical protein